MELNNSLKRITNEADKVYDEMIERDIYAGIYTYPTKTKSESGVGHLFLKADYDYIVREFKKLVELENFHKFSGELVDSH